LKRFEDIPPEALVTIPEVYGSSRYTVARSAISLWAEKMVVGPLRCIHDDVNWKHVGLLPVFSTESSMLTSFLPVLIDCAGVDTSKLDFNGDVDAAIQAMQLQLKSDEVNIKFEEVYTEGSRDDAK
jgi:hypothetical protein